MAGIMMNLKAVGDCAVTMGGSAVFISAAHF